MHTATRRNFFPSQSARGIRELTNDDIRQFAPSVFAETPWGAMSKRYKFVPTIQVVDWMREEGFIPVRAQQGRTRIEGKADFTKHMIRFRRPEHLDTQLTNIGDEVPEITLVNSHDGTTSYQFYPALFRLVCTNGLIVNSSNFDGICVRHKGGDDFHAEIIDASYRIIDETPVIASQVSEFKEVALTEPQQRILAQAALEYVGNETLKPQEVLRTRRTEDNAGTIWTTFNTVQENLVRGGIRTYNPRTQRRATTRGINSVSGDVGLNRALWRMAEEMAKLVN